MQTILVIDDDESLRDTIGVMLEQQGFRAVLVGDGRSGFDKAVSTKPDLVLVDLRLPGMSGAAFIATLHAEFPDGRFVVLTTFDSDEDIYQSFRAGARAFVLKDSFRAEIIGAIRDVHAGGRIVPDDIARRLREREQNASLSPREIQVLALVAEGRSNKRIAHELGISEATVKTHLLRIFEKLDVTDRTSAVTAAVGKGIIRL
jgi:DNA-binding NarL/FixJ family response regulator